MSRRPARRAVVLRFEVRRAFDPADAISVSLLRLMAVTNDARYAMKQLVRGLQGGRKPRNRVARAILAGEQSYLVRVLRAWTALALGKPEDALGLMRAAADTEDRNEKHIVTPGRILSARELLGEMLLALKRPADALKEFEPSQTREPERFRGDWGAPHAAAQSGDTAKAKRNYARLVDMAGQGSRPELAEARAFLAGTGNRTRGDAAPVAGGASDEDAGVRRSRFHQRSLARTSWCVWWMWVTTPRCRSSSTRRPVAPVYERRVARSPGAIAASSGPGRVARCS
jgi:hypothetical protein